ncbi:YeiH family protein [Streptomyces sp. NPDC004838]
MEKDAGDESSHRPARGERDTGGAAGGLSRLTAHVPGLGLTLAIALVATVIGRLFPVVGGPVSGLVMGALLAALHRPGPRLRPGIGTAAKPVLQLAVALLGAQLSLTRILHVGAGALPVLVGSLAACLLAAYAVGRRLRLGGELRTLIGTGTGICGASAIAAVTPVIGAAGTQVAYAISTVFVFNVAAVFVFPALGHLIGMDPQAFGVFAGTAVNDMSSVVAVASAYDPSAVDQAVVVKLTRTLMIIPICLGLAFLVARRRFAAGPDASSKRIRPMKLVPWFLVAFLLAAAVHSAGLVPAAAGRALGELSAFLITVALCAIGLSTDFAGLRRAGFRPLLLGACLWATVTSSTLALQYVTGSL